MKKNAPKKKSLIKQLGKNKQAVVVALLFAVIGVAFIWRSFAANNPNLNGDLNGDNKVTIQDLSILLSNYNDESEEADINGDGQVNASDLPLLLANFGKTTGGSNPTPTPPPPGGSNGDPTAATCPTPTPKAPVTGYSATGCIDFNGSMTGFNPYNGGGGGTVSGRGRVASQCSVKDGYLVALQSTDGATCGGSTGLAQKEGLWEVRMKIEVTKPGNSTHPVLLLWPDTEVWDDGEIDYFETDTGEGATGWLHCVGHAKDNCYRIPEKDIDLSEWHTYSLLWENDKMCGYIDGADWWCVGRDKGVHPNVSMHATVQHDCIGCSMPVNEAAMHVDWMHMYKK